MINHAIPRLIGRAVTVTSLLLLLSFTLVGSIQATAPRQDSTVDVSLVEWAIEMPSSLPAGATTFRVTNDGTMPHNFRIEGEGIDEVFATNLAPGETRTMEVDLAPGTYEVYCPIAGHRGLGMDLQLTVTPPVPPKVGLQLVAEGLTSPVVLKPAPDESGRLFIADQIGLIRILTADGTLLDEPFLDLRDRIVALQTDFDERGLLGLAFHPEFAQNGRFFVYYSAPLREEAPDDWNHTSHVSEFTVSADDANQADPNSERILLQVDQPQFNHDAGQIAFGPDDLLYIPLGDGGGANDVGTGHTPLIGNGQDRSNLLGSILRIDVDGGDPYGIPPDNPFAGDDGVPDEIFAYGFRNPFRIAFDAGGDRQLFVGDAGQNLWEEVDVVTKGNNYGWNIKEGTHCFDPNNPDDPPATCADIGPNGEPLIDPIIEYKNANQSGGIGYVVIGGHVYRGADLPQFEGRYIFGDWSSSFESGDGTLLLATPPTEEGQLWSIQELAVADGEDGRIGAFILSFGHDAENELYVLTTQNAGPTGETGTIYRLVQPHNVFVPLVRTE